METLSNVKLGPCNCGKDVAGEEASGRDVRDPRHLVFWILLQNRNVRQDISAHTDHFHHSATFNWSSRALVVRLRTTPDEKRQRSRC